MCVCMAGVAYRPSVLCGLYRWCVVARCLCGLHVGWVHHSGVKRVKRSLFSMSWTHILSWRVNASGLVS